MSLKYTSYDDICLRTGCKITLNELNAAISKLIENDNSLIPENSIIPKIWECKWYNDNNIAGYNKGDAVWVNTEVLDDFTRAKYLIILNYLLENNTYRDKVAKLQSENDIELLFLLCKHMIATGKLFYIGNITEPVLLKISLVDNNKDIPLDTSRKWKDFFIITDDDTNRKKFLQILKDLTKDLLKLHIDTYHLPETFPIENYLLRDFSNINEAKLLRFKNVKYKNNYLGFDYILLLVRKQYSGKAEKWFRLWSSGYLEHGGVIDLTLDKDYIPSGDSITNCTYTVALDWQYGKLDNKYTAPIYEYEPVNFMDLYCTVLSSDFGINSSEHENIIYDLNDMVSIKTRYIVSLTPYINENYMPYSLLNFLQSLNLYETNIINSIDNSSFMLYFMPKNNDGILKTNSYLYYCAGFTTTMFDRIKKLINTPIYMACECK